MMLSWSAGRCACAALVIGLAISLVPGGQRKIQEQTLTFVPKIVSMAAIAIFTLPWMLPT